MEVALELPSRVVKTKLLQGDSQLLLVLPRTLVLLQATKLKEIRSFDLPKNESGDILDCVYVPNKKSFLLLLSSSCLALIPESMEKGTLKKISLKKAGRKLHCINKNNDVVLACGDCSIVKIDFEGQDISPQWSSSEPESSGQNRKYMDSTCWGDKVGVLSLIGFSGDSKTPQKSKGKRRAELTDDASLNFEVGIYHCDHSNRAYTALTKKTFHTSCTTRDSTPLYCITGNSLSTYLSVIIQVSPTEGKWLKLCSTGKVLFDRSLDISPTAPFPSYIIGGGDGLAVFYCSKASSSGIQPGRIDLWNARYGVQNASKNSSIPFSVATEALSSTSSICLYKASDVYINLFCRSVGQGSGCKYELMRHNLNSLEFPELAMLDPSRLGSAGTLSSMVGRLRPSESSPTQSNKKSKRESAPSIEELSMQAQYSPDLSEREAVDMVSSVLTQHASSDDRISQTQNIFSALVRRNQGFNASILSDSIRKHLSPSASAVCLQMLSHLLYGVCTDIKITGVDEKQLEGPAYDSGILQVITWIEAILDAHFPTFILGCQDRAPNGDSGIEKGNVNIYRNSLMSLMKGLSQLQTSQDLTEAVLGLSCHADRMLRSLSRRKRQQAAATGSITGQSLENWDDTKRNSNGNSDLYQLDIIQF